MQNFHDWKERRLSINKLFLDNKNPRLPISSRNLTQTDLLSELVAKDDVYELAKTITDKGYMPIESLIVIEESGKKVVVEGNRRLSSLKLLLDPNKISGAISRKFRALSQKIDTENIKKAKVTIAPSREAANVYIAMKHTRGGGTNKWNHIEQARFYKARYSEGKTISQIAKDFSISNSEVLKELKLLTMYELACELDLPEDIAAKVRDSRHFPSTTLERIYENQDYRGWLSLDFKSESMECKTSRAEFNKGYSRIVTDIALGKITSRSHNDRAAAQEYLKDNKDCKPSPSKKEKFAYSCFAGFKLLSDKKTEKASTPKKKPAPKKSQRLVPNKFTCNTSCNRLNDVFAEFRKMKINESPNTIAIMFRCILEMSLNHYVEKMGYSRTIAQYYRKKQKKKNDWSPSLNQVVNYLLEQDSIVYGKIEPEVIKSIKNMAKDNSTFYNADMLNAFVHSRFVTAEERVLRGFWEQLEPLFKILLNKEYYENEEG